MRHPTTVLIGLGLLTLSACSGDADPSPAPPATTTPPAASSTAPTPTQSPTQSSTPSPPAMPDAAKAHTKAGAKAFVEHFWDVVNYAQNSGDTKAIRVITVPGCNGCEGGIRAIDEIYRSGGTLTGGRATVGQVQIQMLRDAAGHVLAHATFHLSFRAEVVDYAGTTKDEHHPASEARDRLELLVDHGVWKAAQLEVLP